MIDEQYERGVFLNNGSSSTCSENNYLIVHVYSEWSIESLINIS